MVFCKVFWQGKTPHSVYMRYYALCGLLFWLVIPLYYAWKKYLTVQHTLYYMDETGVGLSNAVNPNNNRFIDIGRITKIEVVLLKQSNLVDVLFHTPNPQIPPLVFHAVTIADQVIDDYKQRVTEIRSKNVVQMISLPVLQ